MELKYTSDIKPEVAQFLKFTYTECRAIVDMFYEEEESRIFFIKKNMVTGEHESMELGKIKIPRYCVTHNRVVQP